MTQDEPGTPAELGGAWRVLAPIWVAVVVLLYLAARELGLRVVP